MLAAALALVLTAPPPLVTTEGVTLDAQGRAPGELPLLGVQVDVGLPDGIGASAIVTPGRFLRLHVGGLNNGLGSGARVGATLIAFPTWAFRPLLGIDAGYVFGGAGAWLPGLVPEGSIRTALSGVSVGFVNAQVGLELGSKNFAFTLRGGVSYVDVTMPSQSIATGVAASVTASGLTLHGFIPSARLGFIVCFG